MTEDKPDTSDVRNALENTAAKVYNTGDYMLICVPPVDIGTFYQKARVNGWEYDSRRVGGDLLAVVEADMGLGELFG